MAALAERGPAKFFWLLAGLNLLNYIDRQAVTGLLEPIRADLNATDAQMGLVGSAFLFTYILLPPLFGWLGDRTSRPRLLGWSAAVWSFATALSGAIRSVGQLAATRGLVGVGEASYMANTPGLISDLYPAAKRGRMMSIFYSAAPIGSAIGVALGGFVAAHWGWRAACFVVGLPGLVAALALGRTADPERGRLDDAPPAPPGPLRPILRRLFTNPAFVLLALGFAGQVFVQNAVEYWLPTILQRDKAIPIAEANATYGMMVMVGGIVGPLLGAVVGDWLLRHTARGYYWTGALAIASTVFPLSAIALSTARVPIFAGVLVEALLGNAAVGLVMAIAMSQVTAEIRGVTTAVLLTTMHLLGDFISWPLVGAMSTAMAEGRLGGLRAVAESFGIAGSDHLTIALTSVALPVALLAGGFYLLSSRWGVRASYGTGKAAA